MCGVCQVIKAHTGHILGRFQPLSVRVRVPKQEDGQAGIQELGGNATLLFYQTAEGEEGRRAFLEKRPPDFSRFPRFP